MLKVEKLATPAAAVTLVGPASVPPLGLALIATVTVPANAVAVLPCASCAVTWTAGVIADAAVALVGWTLNTSLAAAPGTIVNAALVAVVVPLAVAVSM